MSSPKSTAITWNGVHGMVGQAATDSWGDPNASVIGRASRRIDPDLEPMGEEGTE
jgi:hypothetical protein